ncbi:PTS mannose/fructose/sorbose transporter subunit IIAB [Lacticaseibacillus sharpeae]|nr:PTS mannose/fructose/sorbose transporter subunit IIAB [Lacticaseibacillus sharpeae]
MFILTSHGDYAKATLASCQMITGQLDGFYPVSFNDPMGVDDVVAQYQQIIEQHPEDSDVTIIADIPNGTPANAAHIFQGSHPATKVYAGLSLMTLLAIATGTEPDAAFAQTAELAGEVGKKHRVQAAKTASKPAAVPENHGNPLVNVRVDARLIHGQVATMWTRSVAASRIMIVDDEIVQSEVQKATLKTAVPGGVHLSILTAQGAADRFSKQQYNGQRVFLIVRDVTMLQKLVDAGVAIDKVNVGNMSMQSGATQIAKSVAVTPDDVAVFKHLTDKGVKLYHQMVPNDPQADFNELLAKGSK